MHVFTMKHIRTSEVWHYFFNLNYFLICKNELPFGKWLKWLVNSVLSFFGHCECHDMENCVKILQNFHSVPQKKVVAYTSTKFLNHSFKSKLMGQTVCDLKTKHIFYPILWWAIMCKSDVLLVYLSKKGIWANEWVSEWSSALNVKKGLRNALRVCQRGQVLSQSLNWVPIERVTLRGRKGCRSEPEVLMEKTLNRATQHIKKTKIE